MGSCFRKCLPKHEETSSTLNIFPNSSSDQTYIDNVRLCNTTCLNTNLDSFKASVNGSKKSSSTSNDIQLQCLDVRALLPITNHSSPTTSLDLEWEHEIIPFFMVPDHSEDSCTNVSNNISRCPSDSSFQSTVPTCHNTEWSRVSSTNSLEWDSLCPTSPQTSEVDTDTQLLIGEIEKLTRQTLLETGQDILS